MVYRKDELSHTTQARYLSALMDVCVDYLAFTSY